MKSDSIAALAASSSIPASSRSTSLLTPVRPSPFPPPASKGGFCKGCFPAGPPPVKDPPAAGSGRRWASSRGRGGGGALSSPSETSSTDGRGEPSASAAVADDDDFFRDADGPGGTSLRGGGGFKSALVG